MFIEIFLLLVIFLPLFQTMLRRRRFPLPPPLRMQEAEDAAVPQGDVTEGRADDFQPTAMDVLVTKALLQKAFRLPAELIHTIIDHAEYWPHTTCTTNFQDFPQGALKVLGGRAGAEDRFIIRSRPLGFIKPPSYEVDRHPYIPAEARRLVIEYPVEQFQEWIGNPVPTTKRPCRKIVFTFLSHDQGWGGRVEDQGTYDGSYTWFDVGLERFDKTNLCTEDCPEQTAAGEDGGSSASEASEAASLLSTSSRALPTPASSDAVSVTPPRLRVCSLRPIIPQLEPTQDQSGLKFHHAMLPSDMKIQGNVTAQAKSKVHRVVWSWTDDIHPESPEADNLVKAGKGKATGTGDFVNSLKLGDVVTVWARARFPMWVNYVQSAQIDVYWAL